MGCMFLVNSLTILLGKDINKKNGQNTICQTIGLKQKAYSIIFHH